MQVTLRVNYYLKPSACQLEPSNYSTTASTETIDGTTVTPAARIDSAPRHYCHNASDTKQAADSDTQMSKYELV